MHNFYRVGYLKAIGPFFATNTIWCPMSHIATPSDLLDQNTAVDRSNGKFHIRNTASKICIARTQRYNLIKVVFLLLIPAAETRMVDHDIQC